jgi:intein/homing endonuclease
LNSLYGALLNKFFRFGDERMGASVTSSGRAITTHMIESIEYLLAGEKRQLKKHTTLNKEGKYEHEYTIDSDAVVYGDTDSLIGETEVKTNYGTLRLDALFHACPIKTIKENGKQFGEGLLGLKALTLSKNSPKYMNVRSVYRHKVSKARWKVTLEDGKTVEVTNDHSIMVERDGELIEVKAEEILQSDVFISIA